MVAGGIAERAIAQAVLLDAGDVDVCGEQDRAIGEAIGLRDLGAKFVDGELAVPRRVGGRLAIAGGGVDVAARGAGRLREAEHVALGRLANGDVGGGEVGDDSRARERCESGGRQGRPDILADVDREREAGNVAGVEGEVGSEGDDLAGQRDLVHRGVGRHGELTLLVEFAIVGQVGLWHDAEDRAAMDHHRAAMDGRADFQWCADDDDGGK